MKQKYSHKPRCVSLWKYHNSSICAVGMFAAVAETGLYSNILCLPRFPSCIVEPLVSQEKLWWADVAILTKTLQIWARSFNTARDVRQFHRTFLYVHRNPKTHRSSIRVQLWLLAEGMYKLAGRDDECRKNIHVVGRNEGHRWARCNVLSTITYVIISRDNSRPSQLSNLSRPQCCRYPFWPQECLPTLCFQI